MSQWKIDYKILNKKIKIDKKNLIKYFKKQSQVLAQMPDWNPAEIIGKNPKILSSSIYSNLVTNKSWAIAREKMGYSKITNKKLMNLYSGKPYINVRKSFFSFLPQKVNLSEKKIVDFWIEKLKKNPFLHDKIEFDVAVTAYDFEIKKKLKNYLPINISTKTKKKLEFLYKDIFIKNINKKSDANLDKISKKIFLLSQLQKKFLIYKTKKKYRKFKINY